MEIKAVLFDCDGLMFETERIAKLIWTREAERYGVDLPEDFFKRITGAGGEDNLRYMRSIPGLAEVLPQIRGKRFDLEFWGSIQKDCLNKEGLTELFFYLKENGYRTAICSSSGKKYVETLLSTVSVELPYECIVGGDMVKHAKPDPEIFLKGAESLGVIPSECLVLEDSKQGILAAKNAGMHSCFIPDTIEPDQEMDSALEFRAENLREVIGLLETLKREEE
ncbi:MAG: HAD family phosphatase [Solobacterium sp.]|nr:HAD family phosphatase [Solobacterium sp.]